MPEPIKIEEVKERVILVGVSEQEGDDAEDSVAELAELVKTAGAVTVGTLIQKRELIHPGTYVGTGKVQEIADMIAELGATGIVCDGTRHGDDIRFLVLIRSWRSPVSMAK